MIPIIIAGVKIEVPRNDKLNPTANASMLVANDNINKTLRLEEFTILVDSFDNDSYIILNPITHRRLKAIQ